MVGLCTQVLSASEAILSGPGAVLRIRTFFGRIQILAIINSPISTFLVFVKAINPLLLNLLFFGHISDKKFS
jgi:hypothetical protein